MKRNWYKFRVKYPKTMDDGKKKKVSEEYLVDAESFTETEKRANKAATDLIGTRDFDITAISREPVSDIIKGTEQEDNHWYKAVVALVTEDDETGQKKFSPQVMYVNAEDTKEADELLREHMDGSWWIGKSSPSQRPRYSVCLNTSNSTSTNHSKTHTL